MRVAIVDTETTGLGANDEPISVGVILISVSNQGHVLQEHARYEGLREPTVHMDPRAQAVHGLSVDSLRGRSFNQNTLASLFAQADVLIAHNARFDARMLAKVGQVHSHWRCSYQQFPWPSLANRKLDTVCASLSVPRSQTHGAMSDAQALLQCLLAPMGGASGGATYLKALVDQPAFDVGITPVAVSPRTNAPQVFPGTATRPVTLSRSLGLALGRATGRLLNWLSGRP